MTNPFAVVTGASSGIGLELARQLATHGHDLLVCAEDAAITDTTYELGAEGVSVDAVQVDLRTRDGVTDLHKRIQATGRDVDALVLNAGVGGGYAFVDQDVEDILSIVELNCASTVHLARLELPGMITRGAGRVLVTSSIASTMPGAYQAVYNASKSFLQSWTEALQSELADTGVTVTSLMPGPTETNFFVRAGMAANTMIGKSSKDDPAQVAAQGYAAMMAGKRRVVGGGLSTRVQYLGSMVTPDRAKAALHKVMAKPKE